MEQIQLVSNFVYNNDVIREQHKKGLKPNENT